MRKKITGKLSLNTETLRDLQSDEMRGAAGGGGGGGSYIPTVGTCKGCPTVAPCTTNASCPCGHPGTDTGTSVSIVTTIIFL